MKEQKHIKPIKDQTITERFKNAVGIPAQEELPLQHEVLMIEDSKNGLMIHLGSAVENINTLFELSKKIKKEFSKESSDRDAKDYVG